MIEEDEDGDSRGDKVFIEALRDITPGEELTYNYGITLAERHTAKLKKIWECRCGSPVHRHHAAAQALTLPAVPTAGRHGCSPPAVHGRVTAMQGRFVHAVRSPTGAHPWQND